MRDINLRNSIAVLIDGGHLGVGCWDEFVESVVQHYWSPVFVVLNFKGYCTILNGAQCLSETFSMPETFVILKTTPDLGFCKVLETGNLTVSLNDHFKTVDPRCHHAEV
jgi:hypothetical protein